MNEYIGDMFENHTKYQILLHQVNMRGKMGSGVALRVKQMFPVAYSDYMKYYRDAKLGDVLYSNVNILRRDGFLMRRYDFVIANMFGQDRYGYDGAQYTDLYGLETAYVDVMEYMLTNKLDRAISPRLGSGLGGARWADVFKMMERNTPPEITVDVYRLE